MLWFINLINLIIIIIGISLTCAQQQPPQLLLKTYYMAQGHTLTPTRIYQHPMLPLFFTGNQDGKIISYNGSTHQYLQTLTHFKEWSHPWTCLLLPSTTEVLIVTGITGQSGEGMVMRAIHPFTGADEYLIGDIDLSSLLLRHTTTTITPEMALITSYHSFLLIGLTHGQIMQFSFPDFHLHHVFTQHTQGSSIQSILVHSSMAMMYSAATDGNILVWSLSTGQLVMTLDADEGPIQTLAFCTPVNMTDTFNNPSNSTDLDTPTTSTSTTGGDDDDVKWIVSTTTSLVISVWSLSGTLLTQFTPSNGGTEFTHSICLSTTPTPVDTVDVVLLTVSQSGTRRFDLTTTGTGGSSNREVGPRLLDMYTLAIGYDSARQKLVTVAIDGRRRTYHIHLNASSSSAGLELVLGHVSESYGAWFSITSSLSTDKVYVGGSRWVHEYDTESGHLTRTLYGHDSAVGALLYVPSSPSPSSDLDSSPMGGRTGGQSEGGGWLVSADGEGTVRQWNASTGTWIRTWPHTQSVGTLILIPSHMNVLISGNRGVGVMSVSEDGWMRVWDPRTGTIERSLQNWDGDALLQAVLVSVPDVGDGTIGYIVARCRISDVIRVWNATSSTWLYDLRGGFSAPQVIHASTTSSIADPVVYIGDLSGVIRYDVKSRTRVQSYTLLSTQYGTRSGGICSIYVVSRVLFGGQCYDGVPGTYQWDVISGVLVRVYRSGASSGVVYSYGSRVVVAGRDGAVNEFYVPELDGMAVSTRGSARRSSTVTRRTSAVTSTTLGGGGDDDDDGSETVQSSGSSLSALLLRIFIPLTLSALMMGAVALAYWKRKRRRTPSETSGTTKLQHMNKLRIQTGSRFGLLGTETPNIHRSAAELIPRGPLSPVHVPTVTGLTSEQTATGLSGGSTTTGLSHIHTEVCVPAFLELRWGYDFRQEEFVAKGGGGQIYRATCLNEELARRSHHSLLAVKYIATAIETMPDRKQTQFFQEVALMWRFRDHENFIKLFAFSTRPVTMVMKLYQAGDLARFIRGKSSVLLEMGHVYSKWNLVDLFRQVCVGVEHMHQNGIVHCDLKPANVLLDMDANAKRVMAVLADFGISRIIDADQIKVTAFNVSEIRGASMSYAGPEAIIRFRQRALEKNTVIWKAGDVYSLSICLLQMLMRRPPWRGRE